MPASTVPPNLPNAHARPGTNPASRVYNKSLPADRAECEVSRFVIAGSPVVQDKPSSVLHWRIFCEIRGGRESVELNMLRVGDGFVDPQNGLLIISHNPYRFSRNTDVDSMLSVDATRTVTVKAVLDYLIGFRRTCYRFDDQGRGCRFWCGRILADLESLNLIPVNSARNFEAKINFLSVANPLRYPCPVQRGTFY